MQTFNQSLANLNMPTRAEITSLADRIIVVRTGRIVCEMSGREADEDELLAACVGKGASE